MSNLIGQQLGQYKIISLLGRGGMATVYRARQESISRDVAVKVIKPDLAEAEMFAARFEREARTVASFSHPHILKVFDYGQFEDTVYLVMELMTGGSLGDLIKEQTSLSVETTVKLLDQISQALDYAHKRGVIHRDLKPQNVLLDDDQNAFLTDFGIAKVTNSGTGLTQSGIAMGTPSYMPPEQWRGETVDARADIYALGVMLFEMLTGGVPFRGDTPFSMMYKHLNDPPPAVGTIRSDISAAVDSVIYRALAKKPEDRYESAAALSAAFKQALDNGATGQDPNGKSLLSSEEPENSRSSTASGATRARAKGTPPGITRERAAARGTPQPALRNATEVMLPNRGPLPVVLIGLGVAIASVIIIGGLLVTASSNAANQNQTATAAQIAFAGTASSNYQSGTATQLANAAATTANTLNLTATWQTGATVANLETKTQVAVLTSNALNSGATSSPISIAAAATTTPVPTKSLTFTPTPRPSNTLTFTPSSTLTLTPTSTPSNTLTFTPTLTPSKTLTFTPAPPVLTGTGLCEMKTATVNFTLKDVGGPAAGTYIVADSNGFSRDGTLSLLPRESTTLSFSKVYGIVTLIATVNGATQQFTFAAQCGPKPANTLPSTVEPGIVLTITSTAMTKSGSPTALQIAVQPTTSNGGITATHVLTEITALPTTNAKSELAYIARVNGKQGIYVANADGTSQNALANTNNSYSPPLTWAPDRSQIAFVLHTNTGESVWVMNADGTNVTRYAPNGAGTADYPAWSPDGLHIAFVGTVNGHSEIYVMNAVDGSEQHAVTNIGVKTKFLAWGSDSQHIFFISDGVWVATADGQTPVEIAKDPAVASLAVSPNGYQLAVVSGTSIYLLDVQNNFAKKVIIDNGSDPSWAPRSLQLAYSVNGAIYTLLVDGGTPKKIVDSGTQPTWAPNGLHIAYISGGTLFVVPYQGGSPRQIATNALSPVWAP